MPVIWYGRDWEGQKYMRVYLPSKSELEQRTGEELTAEEYEDAIWHWHDGVYAQLDLDILAKCAVDEVVSNRVKEPIQ